MPSAAAEPSLTSSSSGRRARGRRPATTTGSPDHVGRSAPSTWIIVAGRRGPSTLVATSIIVHDALAAGRTPPSTGSAPSRPTGRTRCTRRARPATPARRPPGRSRSRTSGGSERATNWSMATAVRRPAAQVAIGTAAARPASTPGRTWPPGAGARARPSASVPPRSPSAPLWRPRRRNGQRGGTWCGGGGVSHTTPRPGDALPRPRPACLHGAMRAITVFLADDSAIIREGVRAMLRRDADVEVVGVAEDYDGLVAGAAELHPDVVVSDIRMPPHFQREGSTRPRRSARSTPAPASSSSASTTTPTTPCPCSPRARPATPTCSRTASPRATSSAGRSARSPPAARCSTPSSSPP